METKYHKFYERLEWSLKKSNADFISETYRQIFPHLTRIEVVTDLVLQRAGVDKILHFGTHTVFIDEKIRDTYYGDILLEEYSVYEERKIGWLGREKYTDYISYIVLPVQKLYLLPFLILQSVWHENYRVWLKRYGRGFSRNKGYRTSFIPVPTKVLMDTIRDAMTKQIVLPQEAIDLSHCIQMQLF